MKITKALLAVSVLAAAVSQAQAASYTVTGSLNGVNTVGASFDPTLRVHAGTTAYSTAASNWPTFSGAWDILTSGSGGSISGIFGDFEQYSTSVSVTLAGTAVINQPNLVYSFNGGTVAYNAGTRTLTLGQTLVYSNTDSGITNGAASNATLKFDTANGAIAGSCLPASSVICTNQVTHFLGKPDLEKFYLSLTFSEDFSTFSGFAVGADVGGGSGLTATGNTWYSYSFNGAIVPPETPEVPLPAAAWLFGSGLLGLAGITRRRRLEQKA